MFFVIFRFSENSVAWTSQTESVHVKKDDMINSEKEKIINSFRQGHLILNYNKLNQMQKEKLNEQVELLELDVLDLVSCYTRQQSPPSIVVVSGSILISFRIFSIW